MSNAALLRCRSSVRYEWSRSIHPTSFLKVRVRKYFGCGLLKRVSLTLSKLLVEFSKNNHMMVIAQKLTALFVLPLVAFAVFAMPAAAYENDTVVVKNTNSANISNTAVSTSNTGGNRSRGGRGGDAGNGGNGGSDAGDGGNSKNYS